MSAMEIGQALVEMVNRGRDSERAFVDQYYDSEGTLRARADALAANVSFNVKEQRSKTARDQQASTVHWIFGAGVTGGKLSV